VPGERHECGRRTLRAQAHHRVPRSEGGSDALENGDTVCKPCHLRLIHTGRVTVEQVGENHIWWYPGGGW
jgi:5-methylcytosine-specific restriction endonuclease McrA